MQDAKIMKRIIAFIFVVLFAGLFLVSWLPGIYDKPCGKPMGIVGQVGMGVGIVVLFLVRGKKEIPVARNNPDETN